MDKQAVVLICALLCALLEDEAPSGHVYAALMTQGLSFEQFTSLVAGLTATGLIRQSNNVLSLTTKGRETAAKLDAMVA